MSGAAYSAMPPLLRLLTPGTGGRHIIINANHIVSVSASSQTGPNTGGSTVELATGRKVEISKSPDDFWELI
jgi:hypothetical protein